MKDYSAIYSVLKYNELKSFKFWRNRSLKIKEECKYNSHKLFNKPNKSNLQNYIIKPNKNRRAKRNSWTNIWRF
jgi:hypothetical protein